MFLHSHLPLKRIEVRGCLDLRGFALRCRDFEDLTKFGLKHLTEVVLARTLDKSPHVRLSNWEAETLDAQQTEYAANDALVATDIFRYEGVLFLPAIDFYMVC